jgi:hypothetical protein
MQELHVDECIKSATEQISFSAFTCIFKKEFNFHLGHPSLDACTFCNKWARITEAASTSDESSKMTGEHVLHLRMVHSAC